MVKVSGIIIEVGGEQIELSVEEARELFNELQQFFGSETIYVYRNTPNWFEYDGSTPWWKIQPWTGDGSHTGDGVDFDPKQLMVNL